MRRVLITGANKGIGLASVSAILGEGEDTHVLLGSRDLSRGREARASLVEAHPEWADRLDVVEIDVSSDLSVANAAADIGARFDGDTPLYALVNNAGVGFGVGAMAEVLEVNARGIRRVSEAFIPLLDPAKGRVVNVTSAAGPNFVSKCSDEQASFLLDTNVEWSRLDSFMNDCVATEGAEKFAAKGLGDGDSYGLSKACANSYTLLSARENPTLRINACTPGFIETDLTRTYAGAKGISPADMGMKQPEEGTRSTVHLLFGEPEGTGHYYGSDAVRSPMHRYRAPGDPPYTGSE